MLLIPSLSARPYAAQPYCTQGKPEERQLSGESGLNLPNSPIPVNPEVPGRGPIN